MTAFIPGQWVICVKDHPLPTPSYLPVAGWREYIPRGHLTQVERVGMTNDRANLFVGEFFERLYWLTADHFRAAKTPKDAPNMTNDATRPDGYYWITNNGGEPEV